MVLHFPRACVLTTTAGGVDNQQSLGYRCVELDRGQLVLCNWEVQRAALVSIAARAPQDKGYPLKVEIGRASCRERV